MLLYQLTLQILPQIKNWILYDIYVVETLHCCVCDVRGTDDGGVATLPMHIVAKCDDGGQN